MKKTLLLTILWALATGGIGCAAPLNLAANGTTDYVIYHEANAPSSVAMAATDLQDYLARVSGAKAAIVTEPKEPMICLGDNAASRQAGLPVADMPLEGFRIVTRGRNLYILGPDTADGQQTAGGGTSTGTRNGVYAFLEQFLGVRWLIPGEHGDYVPKAQAVSVPETDLTDAPFSSPAGFRTRRRVARRWSAGGRARGSAGAST